jgi:hypothetical protein
MTFIRTVVWCSVFLLFSARSLRAQVQFDVRLEKNQYLAGEPVVVVVDVRNAGDEAVAYSSCDANFRLEVKGARRRVPTNVHGCFAVTSVARGLCVVDHPPLLPPGERTTLKYLLKEYDLGPGAYTVIATSLPPLKHSDTDPAAGAQFERALPLNVIASTTDALKVALAPLVSAAEAADPEERNQARDALIESAAPFLDSLIARLAATDGFKGRAVEALGRMGTSSSRAHLKDLFRRSSDVDRPAIALALATIGDRAVAEFFATLLEDGTTDPVSRRYAALGLGRIGGDGAVRALERVLPAASPEVRRSIATALGNTRSRAAVPVLVSMFGNNPAHNEVCGALTTLTHRAWCDGTTDDPAAKRTRWMRWWRQTGSKASIHGPDSCPPDSIAPLLQPHQNVVKIGN